MGGGGGSSIPSIKKSDWATFYEKIIDAGKKLVAEVAGQW